ncbi:excinuclease UvrABC nuclease subunit [Dysgonomonas sp. PH5-45]|uniref:hypothetical protein n=1 Tax=unclassified Dysgonomonas TaxID=2630389 RepID=UPI00247687DE|nr:MULTISPECIES: hypothetical protein [unclassified Dysgonomonas]MDH6354603.1 excinuclease UvrABC nuclease subunit [Dysgonomonas sp. PH5-45]MDH6387501.1 excinuclease UvrABC nuclease subunit [Dysgonomonas sp. PH5-37]
MKIRRTHNLEFKGFTREAIKNTLPSESGLYFVYRGTRNKGNDGKYTCSLKELLYIGQAEDVNDRVNGTHEHYNDWCSYLKTGEMLYYSMCPVDSCFLDEIEAACIYHAQPTVNIKGKDSYNHEPLRIKSSGNVDFISTDFTVG